MRVDSLSGLLPRYGDNTIGMVELQESEVIASQRS